MRSFNVRHAALLAPWVGIVIAARRPLRDNSFLWHVRAGHDQLDAGEVLRADPYSFTFLDEPWRTQSWLADLAYGWLEGLMGLGFVPWLLLTVGGLTFAVAGRLVWERTDSLVATGAGLLLLTWVGVSFLSPRPVLFSYLALALMLAIVAQERHRWAALPLLWLWASLHGSWVLGLGLLILTALRTRHRRDAITAAAGAVVVSATAHGLAVWGILVEFARNRDALAQITEWAPPNLTSPALAPYAIVVALLLVAAVAGKIEPGELWIIIPFALFGLTSTRALFPAMLAILPFAMTALPRLETERSGVEIPAMVVGLAIIALPLFITSGFKVSESRFPLEAQAALAEVPTFHDDVIGGYLIFRGFPVFVDDRAELFGADHFLDTSRARRGSPVWREIFDRWSIEQVLLRADDGLVEALSGDGWLRSHDDGDFVVLVAPSG